MQNSKTRARLRRIAKWLAAACAVVLIVTISCNWWILHYADEYLHERPYPQTRDDVVAIVPGALVRGRIPSTTLRDRLWAALELYQNGQVQRILVSGDHGRVEYDEVGAMQGWLEERGVPTQDILADHAGFRTLDTMIRARRVFGVERAIVCTQRFHLARAVFLARRAGIDSHGLVVDRQRYSGHYKNKVRETIARTLAVFDSYIWNRQPKF